MSYDAGALLCSPAPTAPDLSRRKLAMRVHLTLVGAWARGCSPQWWFYSLRRAASAVCCGARRCTRSLAMTSGLTGAQTNGAGRRPCSVHSARRGRARRHAWSTDNGGERTKKQTKQTDGASPKNRSADGQTDRHAKSSRPGPRRGRLPEARRWAHGPLSKRSLPAARDLNCRGIPADKVEDGGRRVLQGASAARVAGATGMPLGASERWAEGRTRPGGAPASRRRRGAASSRVAESYRGVLAAAAPRLFNQEPPDGKWEQPK